jgi:sugar/nucleoside kinase (ribokinase family)
MSPEKAWDFAVLGEIFTDLVMSGFPRLPRMGEEMFASHCTRDAGGGTASTACGLASLGASTRIFGVIGACDADWFRERLGAKGVNTECLLLHSSEPTAITVAISTGHDRILYSYAGANSMLPHWLADTDLRLQLAQSQHVHFAHLMEASHLTELTRWLHRQGCTVSIDVGWSDSWLRDPAAVKALAEVDWFFPNEVEAQAITGESDPARVLSFFCNRGLRGVALKLGAKGSAALCNGKFVQQPAIAVQSVDTTGAGDCFDAGFLYAWKAGMTLERCLTWGNICGGLSSRLHGGIAGFPSREEIERILRDDQEKNGL